MGTLNAMLSFLDFMVYIEEAVEKALPDWFLGVPSSRNVEDRWMGVKPKVGDYWEVIT